jgi:hypothetical protein
MTRKWQKLGRVFNAAGQYPWMKSHAQLPVPLRLSGSVYRMFFASRDERQRSHVCFVDVDLQRPSEILQLSARPVLEPGPLGAFDDHGIYAASIVTRDDVARMYVIGWNPGVKAPLFYASIGAAESRDNETFTRVSPAPIMARSEHDPCLVTSPFVLYDDDRWRMWYVSGFRWEEIDGRPQSYYHIKYAESDDGLVWRRDGLVALDHKPGEKNIGRVSVVRRGADYEMWYCYHTAAGYRIGVAESSDGLSWTRFDDQSGIDVSPGEWDSDEVSYPYVFDHEGTKFMLYNGNGFGREGFGLAVEERS